MFSRGKISASERTLTVFHGDPHSGEFELPAFDFDTFAVGERHRSERFIVRTGGKRNRRFPAAFQILERL
jgi:hypothetical protein